MNVWCFAHRRQPPWPPLLDTTIFLNLGKMHFSLFLFILSSPHLVKFLFGMFVSEATTAMPLPPMEPYFSYWENCIPRILSAVFLVHPNHLLNIYLQCLFEYMCVIFQMKEWLRAVLFTPSCEIPFQNICYPLSGDDLCGL